MIEALAAKLPEWMTAKRFAAVSAIVIGLIGAGALMGSGHPIVDGPVDSITRLLEGRSPGERGAAILTKMPKEAEKKKKKEELHQHVLGKVFPPTPEALYHLESY